jgi:hypothetical protein
VAINCTLDAIIALVAFAALRLTAAPPWAVVAMCALAGEIATRV